MECNFNVAVIFLLFLTISPSKPTRWSNNPIGPHRWPSANIYFQFYFNTKKISRVKAALYQMECTWIDASEQCISISVGFTKKANHNILARSDSIRFGSVQFSLVQLSRAEYGGIRKQKLRQERPTNIIAKHIHTPGPILRGLHTHRVIRAWIVNQPTETFAKSEKNNWEARSANGYPNDMFVFNKQNPETLKTAYFNKHKKSAKYLPLWF